MKSEEETEDEDENQRKVNDDGVEDKDSSEVTSEVEVSKDKKGKTKHGTVAKELEQENRKSIEHKEKTVEPTEGETSEEPKETRMAKDSIEKVEKLEEDHDKEIKTVKGNAAERIPAKEDDPQNPIPEFQFAKPKTMASARKERGKAV